MDTKHFYAVALLCGDAVYYYLGTEMPSDFQLKKWSDLGYTIEQRNEHNVNDTNINKGERPDIRFCTGASVYHNDKYGFTGLEGE